jgi:hypothetical protein
VHYHHLQGNRFGHAAINTPSGISRTGILGPTAAIAFSPHHRLKAVLPGYWPKVQCQLSLST